MKNEQYAYYVIICGKLFHKIAPNYARNWKCLYDNDGKILYEGYTFDDKPLGFGTTFWANGNKHEEGYFYFKGLISGMEFYDDGLLYFKGEYKLHKSYGPNHPYSGQLFDKNSNVIYSGKFEYSYDGVGYPVIVKPKEYKYMIDEKSRLHKIMWQDASKLEKLFDLGIDI